MKNKAGIWVVLGVAFLFIGYFSLGIFVIQPIGAIPEGKSILFLRMGMDIPFISSVDGILLKKMGSVSLMSRAMGMAAIGKPILERKIFSFPYIEKLYLISTDGTELSK